ncbi:hypothetical protein [Endozoicomonas sp. ALC020]|uniref:hypothetical protein n=1 Tax=Endozoicomonas sp. ALC020 TaxID=3403077 RepID=UPI003BAFC2F3
MSNYKCHNRHFSDNPGESIKIKIPESLKSIVYNAGKQPKAIRNNDEERQTESHW